MSLSERLAPPPPKWRPEWVKRAEAKRLPAKVERPA